MKTFNKQAMVIVPFSVVEHGVLFRSGRQWWTKKYGSVNYADSTDGKKHVGFEEDDLVIIHKNDVPKIRGYDIVKEVNVINKI